MVWIKVTDPISKDVYHYAKRSSTVFLYVCMYVFSSSWDIYFRLYNENLKNTL